jgi:NAD dependent epimerase/dehydratase family enzyme
VGVVAARRVPKARRLPTLLDKGYTFRFPELEPALRDLLGR